MMYTIEVSLPDNVYCNRCPFLRWKSHHKGVCREFHMIKMNPSDDAYCNIEGNKLRLCAYNQVLRSSNCPLKLVMEE
jgi:hypothetical protein